MVGWAGGVRMGLSVHLLVLRWNDTFLLLTLDRISLPEARGAFLQSLCVELVACNTQRPGFGLPIAFSISLYRKLLIQTLTPSLYLSVGVKGRSEVCLRVQFQVLVRIWTFFAAIYKKTWITTLAKTLRTVIWNGSYTTSVGIKQFWIRATQWVNVK